MPEAAAEAGREAVRRKPDWAKAHFRLGSALAGLDTADGDAAAGESLQQACELWVHTQPYHSLIVQGHVLRDCLRLQGPCESADDDCAASGSKEDRRQPCTEADGRRGSDPGGRANFTG